ncbi:MAG: hypothetical protein AABY53_09285 [Bdellovibrionota bacterium]
MKHFKPISAAFLIKLLISLVSFGATAQTMSQFYYEESAALHWQQRYAAAPSGSWEENQARSQRDQAIERAISSVNLYSTFRGMQWQQVEGIADQLNQKYNSAPSGSAIERMYRQVRDTSYQAFHQALQEYVRQFGHDWRQLHNIALELDQKYNSAPSGSQKERAYDQARRQAYQMIPQAVDQEVNRMWDFREIERHGDYFNSLYNSAPSGSLKETVYNQVRRSVLNQAFSKFSSQAYSLPQQQLWQIQDEYNRRYNGAPRGSLLETYYRQVRDHARSLIRS